MIKNKLTQLMIENFEKAENLKESDREAAFKLYIHSYRLSLCLKNSEYLYNCAINIKTLSKELTVYYYNKGIKSNNDQLLKQAKKDLTRAKKFAKIGKQFEKPFKETTLLELLPDIKTAISKNNKNQFQETKEAISDKIEYIKDFIDNFIWGIGEYYEENSSYEEDDDNDEQTDLSEEDRKILKDAEAYYEAGIDRLNEDFFHFAEIHYTSAANSFKKCYNLAKHKFPELAHNALEGIARSYYYLGVNKESEGDSCISKRDYKLAEEYYYEAKTAYEKGKSYLPNDSEDYFEQAISRVDELNSQAEYNWKYEDD